MLARLKLATLALLCLLMTSTAYAENEGLEKLDEATTLKLTARSIPDLGEVMKLCQEAIDDGLDEVNERIAKKVLAASAFQRAGLLWQQLPNVAANRQNVIELRALVRKDLKAAIEANPEMSDAFLLFAEVEARLGGSIDSAMDYTNKAIELLKDNPAELAKAYVLRAKLQQAPKDKLIDFEKAIEVDPTNTDGWQGSISIRFDQGEFEEAIADAKKLLEKDANNLFALQAVFDSLVKLKRLNEAVELISERIEKTPDNPQLYRVRAQAYRQMSFDQEATEESRVEARDLSLADLNKAIEMDRKDYNSLARRAEIYYEMGENDKANRDISDSLALEMTFGGLLLRSMVAASEGRMQQAIDDLERVVDVAPGNKAWVMQLAQYYQIDNRPSKAVDILDALLKEDQDWEAYRLRGDAHLSLGDHASAIKDYEEALKIADADDSTSKEGRDYSGLLNNYSWVLSTSPNDDIRDGKRALELGLKACEASDYKLAHIISTLAAAYAEVSDFDMARKWSSKAVELAEQGDDLEQLEHLKEELESYKKNEPWREKQEADEDQRPAESALETIDT